MLPAAYKPPSARAHYATPCKAHTPARLPSRHARQLEHASRRLLVIPPPLLLKPPLPLLAGAAAAIGLAGKGKGKGATQLVPQETTEYVTETQYVDKTITKQEIVMKPTVTTENVMVKVRWAPLLPAAPRPRPRRPAANSTLWAAPPTPPVTHTQNHAPADAQDGHAV